MKALVADDDTVSRGLFRIALTRLGVDVVEAADGNAAWQVLDREDAPRFALLDWEMPGINGPDLCRRLRARRGQPYVYAALVTSRDAVKDMVHGFDAGADDFITKPVIMAELAARVQAARRLVELHGDLERSRSYLAAIIEHLDRGAMLTDSAGRIVFANPAYAALFGVSFDEAIGRQRTEHLRARAGQFDAAAPFLAAIESQNVDQPRRGDFEMAAPEQRVLRWLAFPIPLPDGSGILDLYQDVTAEVEQQRAQEHLARTDPLTGLANRRGFFEAVERERSRASRTGAPITAALFDIDHFKRVNDQHGHATGDRVIQHVARCLSVTARRTDVVARWGGEELIALLPDTDVRGGRIFAERVRACLGPGTDTRPAVTVSAGVAQCGDDEAMEDTIARADALLYEAKAAGRNTVR